MGRQDEPGFGSHPLDIVCRELCQLRKTRVLRMRTVSGNRLLTVRVCDV